MRCVILSSPYSGDVGPNVLYARECMLDSLKRREAPFASHLLYPQVLDDTLANQRKMGVKAALAWLSVVNVLVVYQDLGISAGMHAEIGLAKELGLSVEYRTIRKA